MTVNEELRRLLDERGCEYTDRDTFGKYVFHWGAPLHGAMFTDAGEWTELVVENATPEQAIAATLGPMTCQADETDTWECVCDGIGHYGVRMTIHVMECSECGRTYEHVNGGYEHCPHCGRRIVEVDDG